MTSPDRPFGPRLRALRVTKGLALSELARRLYYSKGYVSRVETGAQAPSVRFARRCDVVLEANGELAGLAPAADGPSTTDATRDDHDENEVWVMTMSPDGGTGFTSVGRRGVLLGGMALMASLSPVIAAPHRPASNVATQVIHHRQMLDAARRLGQVAPPANLLPLLIAQTQALRVLAANARGRDATDVHTLVVRTAEFTGWMAQEAGDTELAHRWIRWSAETAGEAGDDPTATYALVRQAQITMYQGDSRSTVELAQAAQTRSAPPRIAGLAAQREAQGHALAGDYSACMRALDRAARLLETARLEAGDGPTIGTSHVSDPAAAVTGWCLYDLGRPKEAVAVLEHEVARIPRTALRARLRFGMRLALAHAGAGQVEQACLLAQEMVGQTADIGSATVLSDVRRLSAELRRWPNEPAVRQLGLVFASALYRRPT